MMTATGAAAVRLDRQLQKVSIPAGHSLNIVEETAEEILEKLLKYVEPISFEDYIYGEDPPEKVKISRKQYIVVVIEEVLRLASRYNWDLCQKHEFVFVYNGKHWIKLEADLLKWFLGESAERLGVSRWDCRHFQFRDELYRQFISAARLKTPNKLDGVVLIPLQNGTFEISESGQRVREHRKEDFLTYCLPFGHDPAAEAPMFTKFLGEVLPDPESQGILAEFIGYVFIKGLKLEKALMLIGAGANGKSVIHDIIMALLGRHNVTNFSLQSLTDKSGYQRAEIWDKLLNYASEINTSLESSVFKALTSGEAIEARQPYGRPFIIENYARFMFNTNNLPTVTDHTNAFFRRFVIIPFEKTIPTDQQDKELAKKIISSELPGIFNWVLDGLQRVLEQRKFSHCEASDRMVGEYKTTSDSVMMFIEENGYEPSFDYTETRQFLYATYRGFCLNDGYRPVSAINFSKRLQAAGYEYMRKADGFHFGITK